MAFYNDVRDMTADILITDKKTASLGGLPYGASTKLVGEFLAVIFAPQHLDLIKGGPAERRKFLNQALCQLKPNYAKALTQFNRAMQQRNQLLKDAIYHSELYDTLDVWDDRFCSFGSYVISERMKYLDELRPFLEEFYGGISGGREQITVEYAAGAGEEAHTFSSEDPAGIKEELAELLKAHRREDAFAGFTTVGPHRDDLLLELNGTDVRTYGSQGQQRTTALSLKLSEIALIERLRQEKPVLLLDDVFSELDEGRRSLLLSAIDGCQGLITCTHLSELGPGQDQPLQVFRAGNGKLIEV